KIFGVKTPIQVRQFSIHPDASGWQFNNSTLKLTAIRPVGTLRLTLIRGKSLRHEVNDSPAKMTVQLMAKTRKLFRGHYEY
ncbi:MAG: hypothetical protein K8R79_02740, partial [Calditrichales bacterium]|nr:hypothetical protein [Calditrichales bacterium]